MWQRSHSIRPHPISDRALCGQRPVLQVGSGRLGWGTCGWLSDHRDGPPPPPRSA